MEISVVSASISLLVYSLAVEQLAHQFSLKSRLISPDKLSIALLLSINELADVDHIIVRPSFNAFPMLPIIGPLSLVSHSTCAHGVAFSMCFAVEPLALVKATIWMNETANPISHVAAPESIILRTVWPDLGSSSLTHAFFEPSSVVYRPIVHFDGR